MAVKTSPKIAARFNWKTARRIVQYLVLAVFILLFIGSRRSAWPLWLTNLPMRLDPSTMLANAVASREVLPASLLALLTIALTIVLGRVWCGWICPLGSLLDLFTFKRSKKDRPVPADAWRRVKYGVLVAILVSAIFANLTLLVFDPLTILFRTLSASLWPALDTVATAVETALYSIPLLQTPVVSFDEWVRPLVLPPTHPVYRDGVLYALVFFTVLGLNILSPRFWCRYFCPMGAFLGLISKVSLVKREVNDRCKSCGICSQRCPTGAIDADRHYASDPGECIVCMDCIQDCPRDSNEFKARPGFAGWNSYDPSRRQVLSLMGATVVGIAVTQSSSDPSHPQPGLIQPPGARENDILQKCIRCGECSRACPTNAIQPSTGEAGLIGLWTPILVPRLGYCDYSCHACGQVCPVEAIPALTLELKRKQVIGQATIDQNRCIAWALGKSCIVCEEMCPVPDKAILLEKAPARDGSSQADSKLLVPRVDPDKCIGCGICEYRCPVNGQSAIRVFSLKI